MRNIIKKILKEELEDFNSETPYIYDNPKWVNYDSINESEDDDYIDRLLDKINQKGIDSLSSAERNRMDKISTGDIEDRTLRTINGEMYIGDVSYERYNSPEYKQHIYPKSDEVSDASRMFYSQIEKMGINSIEINDEVLPVEIIEEMSGKHLRIGNYIFSPFWEGMSGIVVSEDNGNIYTIGVNHIPKTIKGMNKFINVFLNNWIFDIIK